MSSTPGGKRFNRKFMWEPLFRTSICSYTFRPSLASADIVIVSFVVLPLIAVVRWAKNGFPYGSTSETYARYPCNFSNSLRVVVSPVTNSRRRCRYFSCFSGAVLTRRDLELQCLPRIICSLAGGGVFVIFILNSMFRNAPILHIYVLKCFALSRLLFCLKPPKMSSTWVPSTGGLVWNCFAYLFAADFANNWTGGQNSSGLFVFPNGHAKSI